MSTKRGCVNRSGGQKHQNVTAFKNNKYDGSKRTKLINSLQVAEVCKRCHDIIAWKIKYKKYKLLSQPKTCVKCHQKKIKDAYHVVCIDCSKELDICCKCGKKEEIVAHKGPTEQERIQTMAQLEVEVKALSERKRRAYYRYIDRMNGKKKKKRTQSTSEISETEKVEETNEEELGKEENEEKTPLSLDEYFKNAREKLEELQKKMENEMFDDFDDFDLGDSSGDEIYEAEGSDDDEEDDDKS